MSNYFITINAAKIGIFFELVTIFSFFFHIFLTSPLISVFFTKEIELKAKPCIDIFEILQTSLQA